MGDGVDPHYRPRADTVVRSVRTSRALWDRARERARERGETVNDVLNDALRRYVNRDAPEPSAVRRLGVEPAARDQVVARPEVDRAAVADDEDRAG